MNQSALNEPRGSERRQHNRKTFRSVAQLRLAQQAPAPVRTADISASGLAVTMSVNLPAGTLAVVQFVLPKKGGGGTLIELEVMTVHSVFSAADGGFRTGLQFSSVSPEVAKTIARFINGQ
jgi:c-di-GMP-binding flagellar brake protein YcgR